MIYPIRVFGDEVLRAETTPVEQNSEELQKLIDDMIETMHGAAGIGLAAPQIGRTERLFVIDLDPLVDELRAEGEEVLEGPRAFINPEIVAESEEACDAEEGCLSIPEIREVVSRPERIRVRYLDRRFEERELEAGGMLARVIQHENDHLHGTLFTDYLSGFRRSLLKRKLRRMTEGDVTAEYPLATDLA